MIDPDTQKLNETIYEKAIALLDDEYHLIYVDYDDKLNDEQVGYLVAREWDELYDSISEWETDTRCESSSYERSQVLIEVQNDLEAEMDKDLADEFKDFEFSNEYDEILWAIEERDTSDPIEDLARNCSPVLMRQVIANEDTALYGNHTPEAVLQWLTDNAEEGSVVPANEHNLGIVDAVVAESMHSLSYTMGMLVYAVSPSDFLDLPYNTKYVEIVNPYLYLGNYYNGDGYCSGDQLEAVFRVKRSEITTDKSAAGYGWDEVAGVFVSAYAGEIRPVAVGTVEAVSA